MAKREEVNILIRKSRGFLETAEQQIHMGLYDLAAFSLEQALQLHLKAKPLEKGVEFPRTHSVRRLLEMFAELTGDKTIYTLLNNCMMELGVLEDAYISSRYGVREFRKEEAQKLVEEGDGSCPMTFSQGGVAQKRGF
ncbi:MAG: HEPN domain-containing protein [Candidatus Caldarchaeum sp.]|nr:HEPN domain-containing protein [Candidatus Caldarchaeum sp.]